MPSTIRQPLIAAALAAAFAIESSTPADGAICLTGCNCSVGTASLTFGAFSPASQSPVTMSGSTTVSCTGTVGLGVNILVTLSAGSSGTFAKRTMVGANGGTLGYQIYTSGTTVFGDGTAGTSTLSYSIPLAIGGSSVTVPYSGQIFVQNAGPSGVYSDGPILTVNY